MVQVTIGIDPDLGHHRLGTALTETILQTAVEHIAGPGPGPGPLRVSNVRMTQTISADLKTLENGYCIR